MGLRKKGEKRGKEKGKGGGGLHTHRQDWAREGKWSLEGKSKLRTHQGFG